MSSGYAQDRLTRAYLRISVSDYVTQNACAVLSSSVQVTGMIWFRAKIYCVAKNFLQKRCSQEIIPSARLNAENSPLHRMSETLHLSVFGASGWKTLAGVLQQSTLRAEHCSDLSEPSQEKCRRCALIVGLRFFGYVLHFAFIGTANHGIEIFSQRNDFGKRFPWKLGVCRTWAPFAVHQWELRTFPDVQVLRASKNITVISNLKIWQ